MGEKPVEKSKKKKKKSQKSTENGSMISEDAADESGNHVQNFLEQLGAVFTKRKEKKTQDVTDSFEVIADEVVENKELNGTAEISETPIQSKSEPNAADAPTP